MPAWVTRFKSCWSIFLHVYCVDRVDKANQQCQIWTQRPFSALNGYKGGVGWVYRGLRVGMEAAAGQTFCMARIKKSFKRFGVQ